MGAFIDITGQRFGRWLVLEYAGRDKNNLSLFKCKCDCGTIAITRSQDLRTGKSRSCGCINLERLDKQNRKHSMAGTRPYRIWKGMKTRCYNPNAPTYKDYGERGIEICEEWRDSFESFWINMHHGYADDLEIDRIDYNGNYCPENCRWVDKKTQNRNTRQNHFITTPLGYMTIGEFAERTGIPYDYVKRLVYKGIIGA